MTTDAKLRKIIAILFPPPVQEEKGWWQISDANEELDAALTTLECTGKFDKTCVKTVREIEDRLIAVRKVLGLKRASDRVPRHPHPRSVA